MNFLITGGSRGLGRQLVLDMVSAGHGVAFTFLQDEAAAHSVEDEARGRSPGANCRSFKLDQRVPMEVEEVCSTILDEFEEIDALINNAAVNRNGLAVSISEDDWANVLDTNLSGPFYVSRQLLLHFLGQGHGRFIHISSVASNGASGQICYAASKAGLVGLSGTLAREYGRKGITSNVLVLGMLAGGMADDDASARSRSVWNEMCPLRREGHFSEVSDAVAYLASAGAAYVNGQEINLTGGMNWVP